MRRIAVAAASLVASAALSLVVLPVEATAVTLPQLDKTALGEGNVTLARHRGGFRGHGFRSHGFRGHRGFRGHAFRGHRGFRGYGFRGGRHWGHRHGWHRRGWRGPGWGLALGAMGAPWGY